MAMCCGLIAYNGQVESDTKAAQSNKAGKSETTIKNITVKLHAKDVNTERSGAFYVSTPTPAGRVRRFSKSQGSGRVRCGQLFCFRGSTRVRPDRREMTRPIKRPGNSCFVSLWQSRGGAQVCMGTVH